MGDTRALFLHFHSDDSGAVVSTLGADGIKQTTINRELAEPFLQSLFAVIDAYDVETTDDGA